MKIESKKTELLKLLLKAQSKMNKVKSQQKELTMKPSAKELECIRASWKLRKELMKLHISNLEITDETKMFLKLKISRLNIDDSTEEQPEIIKELLHIYRLDHEVPPVKSFYLLWRCILLRDIKDEYYYNDYFSQEKIDCMYDCVKILYNDTKPLIEIYTKHDVAIHLTKEEFYKNHINGWIRMVSTASILPSKIDELYGPYNP